MLKLIGKPAITAVTTGNSGMKATEKFINTVFYLLGAIPVGHLRGNAFKPGEFPNRIAVKEKNRKLAAKVVQILNGEKKIRPALMNKVFFWGIKQSMKKNAQKRLKFEFDYWDKKGWFKKTYSQAAKVN